MSMMRNGRVALLRDRHRGSILMETVLVMPLLLLLIFGIVQFALCWTARQMTVYAAFCGARALTVISPRDNAQVAVDNAAKLALSWMCLVDGDESQDVKIPGWGRILGSGSVNRRVTTQICTYYDANGIERLADGNGTPIRNGDNGVRVNFDDIGDDRHQFAAVRVAFRYPLLILPFGVNRIIGTAINSTSDENLARINGNSSDFYSNLSASVSNPNDDGYGLPFMTFVETCVLPMPYSTRNFPWGGFDDMDVLGGQSSITNFNWLGGAGW